MMIRTVLFKSTVYEVKELLHKIKLDNIRKYQVLSSEVYHSSTVKSFWTSNKLSSCCRVLQMGSFTSMPKVIPTADDSDSDVSIPESQNLTSFLSQCRHHHLPSVPPLQRSWMKRKCNIADTGESLRIFQWNVLSQTLGTKHDIFVKCPPSALHWKTRRFRMLEEIGKYDPDILCLQEVDHFRFLQKSLGSIGYLSSFLPKPDSPCLYLPENSGPDGCAIFYKKDKFENLELKSRVIEVWHVQSNQVAMMMTLKSKKSGKTFIVATTHLKARSGALLTRLRDEQGKDLLEFLSKNNPENHPVILTGDFNAEPSEPVYNTITSNSNLRLFSTYKEILDREPSFTTWKIREDGEHVQTLDYIFHSHNETHLTVESVLEMPTEEAIGETRIPSYSYPSDHFSLLADFIMT